MNNIYKISTHTPLAGRDWRVRSDRIRMDKFLLTRPSRGATRQRMAGLYRSKISTHTPLAGRDCRVCVCSVICAISTHTPLAGRDGSFAADRRHLQDFYSHAPRGARLIISFARSYAMAFLLTRPSRGATSESESATAAPGISTHTPLAGRDFWNRSSVASAADFYSHAPRGARLIEIGKCLEAANFYSHAPRGARPDGRARHGAVIDFYSHAPRGARQNTESAHMARSQFLLTRPSRGATPQPNTLMHIPEISTHTPLAGRDLAREII